MIVVRNIFQIRAGSMKQAVALMQQGRSLPQMANAGQMRALTDVTGEFYTLVLEVEFESLQAFESGLKTNFGDPQWQAWYQQFTPLIQSGRREIMQIVE